jgi:hypothetical protein
MRLGLLFLAACVAMGGCSGKKTGEPAKFPVQGVVALDGKPMPAGTIFFKTTATGAIDSLEIKDGKFEGKAQAGDRRVEICAYEKVAAKPNDPMSRDTQKNTIPAQYNLNSKLTAKVGEEGANEFKFDVTSR